MMDALIFSRENHIGLITLNRPQSFNALTLPMICALRKQLEAWQDDPEIHAVVIRAEEGKAFCAGGDVRELYRLGCKGQHAQQLEFFWNEYQLNHYIHQYTKPYIALMDGITMGGGVGISLHGSHPVATERFSFAMPETGIGFFPDIGASYLLSRCSGEFGIYLGLTGARLTPDDAFELGLVKHYIASDALSDALKELTEADLSKDPYKQVDACLSKFAIPDVLSPVKAFDSNINESFVSDDAESIFSNLREGGDEWHIKTAEELTRKSPLSLKVTLAQFRRSKGMSLSDCLKIDYCLVNHFIHDHDFYEGVRALLIDKDKSPTWEPLTLLEVSNERVSDYFSCILGESIPSVYALEL